MQSACTQRCNQHAIGGRRRRPRLLEQHHLSLNVGRGEAARERGDPCVDLGQVPVALELPCDFGRGGLASLTPARLFEHGGGTGGLRRTCELERVLLRLGSRSLKPRARQIGDRIGLVPDEGCTQRLSEAIEIIGLQSSFRSGLVQVDESFIIHGDTQSSFRSYLVQVDERATPAAAAAAAAALALANDCR